VTRKELQAEVATLSKKRYPLLNYWMRNCAVGDCSEGKVAILLWSKPGSPCLRPCHVYNIQNIVRKILKNKLLEVTVESFE
jgi:hypothetical protein